MTEIVNIDEARRERKLSPGFCMTQTAAAIFHRLDFCRANGLIGLIVGAPGVGKTVALACYTESEHATTYLVTASEPYRRLAPALELVCEAMRATVYRSGAASCREAIVRTLGKTRERPLLIVDEAGYLDDQPLDALRSVHDETGCGLVLAGNAEFRTRLNGKVGQARFAQLTSRIGMRLDLEAPTREDVAAMCDHYRIAGKEARRLIEKLVEKDRGLRIVRHLARAATNGVDRPITIDDLRAALSVLGRPQ